jgi:hypothetical protein
MSDHDHDDDAPKSAVEIAMEKLRARGDYEETKLTDEQKAEIADIRSMYRSKIAEAEIQHASQTAQVASMEELESLKEELSQEKERLSAEMEKKVQAVRARARSGSASGASSDSGA